MSKELSDNDILDIWLSGLDRDAGGLKGFAQYRLPSGMIRLVYTLKEPTTLSAFVQEPFFNYTKSILGDVSTYTCKVLNLNTIPTATIGSEVISLTRIYLIE